MLLAGFGVGSWAARLRIHIVGLPFPNYPQSPHTSYKHILSVAEVDLEALG